MENRPAQGATHEEACARVSALFRERWLRQYVASKLRRDAVFSTAFELLRESNEPILDVGCGVGLLSFYLRARGVETPVTGLDIDRNKIHRARSAAVETGYAGLKFLEQDATRELPEFLGNVALFDALHYLKDEAQFTLLRQLATRIAPGGLFLLRDCPRDRSPRFWATVIGEIFAQTISWNIKSPLHFPTRASITAAFSDETFTMEEKPMFRGGPFNNRLFIFRRKPSEVRHLA